MAENGHLKTLEMTDFPTIWVQHLPFWVHKQNGITLYSLPQQLLH
jgi:hypothetical protein